MNIGWGRVPYIYSAVRNCHAYCLAELQCLHGEPSWPQHQHPERATMSVYHYCYRTMECTKQKGTPNVEHNIIAYYTEVASYHLMTVRNVLSLLRLPLQKTVS